MREITSILLHCSASEHMDHDDISVIREWHLARGWDDVGYHFFLQKNGNAQVGRKLSVIGAHCKGYNRTSIGICMHGRDSFTRYQWDTLFYLVDVCMDVYDIDNEGIYCHYELDKHGKTCPNFKINYFRQEFERWKKRMI